MLNKIVTKFFFVFIITFCFSFKSFIYSLENKSENLKKNSIPNADLLLFKIPFPIYNLSNPSLDFLITSDLSNSLSNLSYLTFYKIFSYIPLSHWSLRITEFLITSQVLSIIDFIAHEFGHQRIQFALYSKSLIFFSENSVIPSIPFFPFIRIIGSNWIFSFNNQKINPFLYFKKDPNLAYNYNSDYMQNFTRSRSLFLKVINSISGLNQEIHRASLVFKYSVLKKKLNLVDSHIIVSNLGYFTFYNALSWVAESKKTEFSGDPSFYIKHLKSIWDLNIKIEKMFFLSLITNLLLNTSFYQYYYLLFKFFYSGERTVPIIHFKNFVSAPLFRYIPTYDGELLDFTLPFLKPIPIFLNLGFGLSQFLFRSGIEVFSPKFFNDIFSIHSYFYINYLNHIKTFGFKIASQFNLHIPSVFNHFNFFLYLSYSHYDLLDSIYYHPNFFSSAYDINKRYNAFYIQVGFMYKFYT